MVPTTMEWPAPWAPLVDEAEALCFGRSINEAVASTVVGELRREICRRHPLYAVDVGGLGYDTKSCKDFLFETARPDMPLVRVHFTWVEETNPVWPQVEIFPTFEAFRRAERKFQARWWEFWK